MGHAAFRITAPSGKTILVDPWLTNPSNPTGKDDVKKVAADLILVTHGHFDHVGDANEISKRTKAKLVATFDLGNALLSLLDGEVAITFVPAVHSSNVGDKGAAGGNPGGFVRKTITL